MLSTFIRCLCLLAITALIGCTEEEPIKLGFIGGTSGRVADLGVAGRNGFTLAVEEQNAKGGINRRNIEVIYKDDQQRPQRAQELVDELIKLEVDAIIGPMTSAMAVAVADRVTEAQLPMMSCTATTDQLSGRDDYFFRPLSAISNHSEILAKRLTEAEPQATKAVAILDYGNQAYTENWLAGFKSAFEKLGGEVKAEVTYISGDNANMVGIAKAALRHEPSLILLSMNSVDAAIIAKQIRITAPDVVIASSEWAGTERLIELGGRHVDNMYVPQYVNRASQKPPFIRFSKKYEDRFKESPGFPGLFCYEATRMVIQAIQNEPGNIKQALLKLKHFQGIQSPLQLDKFGDGKSTTFITQVQAGQFVVLEQ